jgi:hypothetical protein
VTTEVDAGPAPLPPDPEAYDSPRAQLARARGLAAPYIAGGRDPDPGPALAEERRLTRWLVLMVVALVLGGFVIGLVLAVLTSSGT